MEKIQQVTFVGFAFTHQEQLGLVRLKVENRKVNVRIFLPVGI